MTSANAPRLVAISGGPGGGKTTVLDMLRHHGCKHTLVLPEAANILWRGGFPRRSTPAAQRAAQRSILRVQRELERMAEEEGGHALILCDRGTLDGLGYWDGDPDAFLADLGTTRERELARYAAVIQLQPPTVANGYVTTGLRIETAEEAAAIDARIAYAWRGHPHHVSIGPEVDFVAKVSQVMWQLQPDLPRCCRAAVGDQTILALPALARLA